MDIPSKTLVSSYHLSDEKKDFFLRLSYADKTFLLRNLHRKSRREIFGFLNDVEIEDFLVFLDPDEVRDVLHSLSEKRRRKILFKLNSDVKKKVDLLLKFSPTSAAGIMSVNYILVEIGTSRIDILKRIKKHLSSGKKEPTILVVSILGKLLGELRLSSFLFEKDTDIFSHLRRISTVRFDVDQEECIHQFKQHKHEKIVVLDEKESVLGLIHARDIFKIIEEENTEDFYGIAGLRKEEDITDSAFEKVRFRLGWLFINLFTAFLAAFVVSQFDDTISELVILAAFMPIVAGMGGNAGTQTTAILIRSLALKRIDVRMGKRILFNEILAGTINGVFIGFVVAIIAYIFGMSPVFGAVVGFAILANIMIAAMFGTIVPLLMKTFGADPAASSSVFVTTATDVFGFMILLGVASFVLL